MKPQRERERGDVRLSESQWRKGLRRGLFRGKKALEKGPRVSSCSKIREKFPDREKASKKGALHIERPFSSGKAQIEKGRDGGPE